ncbi:MAG TPA: hypothetical protein VFB96_04005, partial [Pirellulaceae bacterium]|nr:hypothetical protein [Pirellulaceae bacterium]
GVVDLRQVEFLSAGAVHEIFERFFGQGNGSSGGISGARLDERSGLGISDGKSRFFLARLGWLGLLDCDGV